MELDSVAKIKRSFFRLVGTESDDPALTNEGESSDEVVELLLTEGARAGQRWMLNKAGYQGWRKRSSALSFSGTDAADGGRYTDLPSDFLRAYGSARSDRSALVEANGDHWGREIDAEKDYLRGDLYYLRGEQLWVARDAKLPATLYLEYHYKHPSFEGITDANVDFPMEARTLIVGEAAHAGMHENWLTGGEAMESKISRYLNRSRERARHIGRRTKSPRRFRRPPRYGNRW